MTPLPKINTRTAPVWKQKKKINMIFHNYNYQNDGEYGNTMLLINPSSGCAWHHHFFSSRNKPAGFSERSRWDVLPSAWLELEVELADHNWRFFAVFSKVSVQFMFTNRGSKTPIHYPQKMNEILCDIGGKFFQRILPWNFRAPNFHMRWTIIELRMCGQDSSQNLDTEISKLKQYTSITTTFWIISIW